jgi:hypothetical protein
VARLYPQALGCLFVASYDSQGYGGGIGPRLLHSNGRGADHIENTVLILSPACMLRALPNNGRCLKSRCFATGLYATIYFAVTFHSSMDLSRLNDMPNFFFTSLIVKPQVRR